MLPIITLPNGGGWRSPQFVDAFGDRGFERADDGWNGTGYRFSKTFNRIGWDTVWIKNNRTVRGRGTARRAPTGFTVNVRRAIRPYRLVIDNMDNSVEMVGHDDKFTQFDLRADDGSFQPFFPRDLTERTQAHAFAIDFSNMELRPYETSVIKYSLGCE